VNEQTNTRRLRVLFLNTSDSFGADYAVHLGLVRNLDRTVVKLWAAANTAKMLHWRGAWYASREGISVSDAFASVPDTTFVPVPLGGPFRGLPRTMQARAVLGNARAVGGVWRLARLCKRQRIDVVHVTDRPRDVMVGWVVARLGGCRLLVHAHTNYGKPAGARFAARIADWILRQADGLVAVSRFTANSYVTGAGLRENRVFAVHNSVDASLFSPEVESASRTAMRERLGIPPEVPVIASVARLTRWKGQLQLLEAFARLRQRFPQARLVLAGSSHDTDPEGPGDYRDFLERKAHALCVTDAVSFAGYVDAADMPAFYAAIDVFVHAAVSEVFPLVVLEAMASAKPVISVGVGGIPELIRDDQDGLLIDPPELEAAIGRLLESGDFAQSLGKSARSRVIDAFNPAKQAAEIVDVYRVMCPKASVFGGAQPC
jgi:glycosyltransferase involved in cell wall biosynthesis